MFIGCQFSLYPMADGFVGVILDAIKDLDKYTKLRRQTDDLSTLLVGPPEELFPALEECFTAASRSGEHVVMQVTFSRGCPGEPDDPICRTDLLPPRPTDATPENLTRAALERLRKPEKSGIDTACQISLYPLGGGDHMADIYACIAFLKASTVNVTAKNFCTRLDGDAADVMAVIEQTFIGFAHPGGHVVLTATLSANSPSKKRAA
ncbi:YkoF family thiamine/hydroxymethylpyrimidine-binding protein [Lacibacterium aquatile]|uniref:YkoF family thiamine/hydroxymethylpyrimidine-binding protein n=1 Tax=Lacibacterium aquatile TaxID=1168082 RepID=A0ABW5DW67_9PROT